MSNGRDKVLQVQRDVLATMRRMFVTGMACFKAMDYQLEQFVRLLSRGSAESQKRSMMMLEEWTRNFRKAREDYQKFVEDSFERAESILEGAKDKKPPP